MIRNKKATVALCFFLALAVSILFIPPADTAWAEEGGGDAPDKAKYLLKAFSSDDEDEDDDGDGCGLHRNKDTFQKNFALSDEQKRDTITRIDEIVKEKIKPGMSDLEKYYTLAVEANKIAEYDWDFWGGRYFLEYYSHQWDSYGVLNERSVCAGIAIFYSHLCHAADLPCLFVITDPESLDHTINYIPDINGNAYFVDVTENTFLMSDKSNVFMPAYEPNFNCDGPYVDYKDHPITDCTDYTFDYCEGDSDDGSYACSSIKDYYDVTFDEWFDDFGRHNNAEKIYPSEPCTEVSTEHVSYYKYRSNFVGEGHDKAWFLEDFYKDPAAVEAKILNKEFDDDLVNVSGVKKNYNCDTPEDLEAAVTQDIKIEYFPSIKNGEVVPEVDNLQKVTDYIVKCTSFKPENNTAELTVTGAGGYSGTYQISVALNSAAVAKAPVPKKGLVYTGKDQVLIEPGEAEAPAVMQYAIGGSNTEPPETFTTKVEDIKKTDAGVYYVWYKAVDGNKSSKPEPVGGVVKISKMLVNIIIDEDSLNINIGETATISPTIDKNVKAKFTYTCEEEDVATVDDDGVVTGVGNGFTNIFVSAEFDSDNFDVYDPAIVNVQVGGGTDIDDTRVVLSQTAFTYNGKVQRPTIKKIKRLELEEGTDYTATWSNESSKNAGTYTVTIKGIGEYYGTTDATYTINKAANPMTLKAKTVKVKRKSIKKKSKTIKMGTAFTVSNAQGALSYKLVSAKKGKKSFKKKFKVNKKTGNVTVKKKLKKGTYKVKVKVNAAGNANYNASGWKTVTFKVRVK